jgi:hypothetical protein
MNAIEFGYLKKLFLEAWPAELAALSMPHVGLPLSLPEAAGLGGSMAQYRSRFGRPQPQAVDLLLTRLSAALQCFPMGGFVRLGSRSPKDSRYILEHGPRVFTARQAWYAMTEGSARLARDLERCISQGYSPHLFVRQWMEIPPCAEFRCFMRNRALVGISQYDCINVGPSEYIRSRAEMIESSIRVFFAEFVKRVHVDEVVFDVFVTENGASCRSTLLDLNPFSPMSDSCLFKWAPCDFDGTFRYLGS